MAWLSDVELAARDGAARAAVGRRSEAIGQVALYRSLWDAVPHCRVYASGYRGAVAELDVASDAAEAALNAAFAKFCGGR